MTGSRKSRIRMSIPVELPSLGESVFEGTISRWLVGEGEWVEVDQPIVEVTTDKVDAVHAKALELGGTDEGAPGPRGEQIYAGYFRDLDGNKFNAFCMTGG